MWGSDPPLVPQGQSGLSSWPSTCPGAMAPAASPQRLCPLSLASCPLQSKQNFTFELEPSVAEQEAQFQSPKYIFHGFMERLWAYLTIRQLLEQMWVAAAQPGGGPLWGSLGLSLSCRQSQREPWEGLEGRAPPWR